MRNSSSGLSTKTFSRTGADASALSNVSIRAYCSILFLFAQGGNAPFGNFFPEKEGDRCNSPLQQEKSSNMEVRCEGVSGTPAKPPTRARRRKIPLQHKKSRSMEVRCEGVSGATAKPRLASAEAKPLQRKRPAAGSRIASPAGRSRPSGATMLSRSKKQLGALLREREVTGRDASLPAPLLSAFDILVARGTVGALPQTPPEALPLDSARGIPP